MTGKRTDRNHAEIVKQLRGRGYSAFSTASVGRGFGDLAVGKYGRNFFFEVKDPNQPPSARRLTDAEEKFHQAWQGQIDIIETADEAIAIMEDVEPR